MTLMLVPAPCPVCGHSLAAPLFDGGKQTLATLGWPATKEMAQAMPRFGLNFVQCPKCSHVWNRTFGDGAIPYENNPNRMFNQGTIWKGHLADTRDLVLSYLPDSPTVIDIGCGEGHFIRGVAEAASSNGRFIGFDPAASEESGRGIEFHARYFDPLIEFPKFSPDLLVMRHVLEHLTDPAAFLENLAWAASTQEKPIYFFAEMPCIDRSLETNRLVDFFYEHFSHFTTTSFRTLMEKGGKVLELAHGYDREVIYGLVRLGPLEIWQEKAASSQSFQMSAYTNKANVEQQLNALVASGKSTAIWGGTGKAATFIHQYGATADKFPLVVDSDPDKVGTFVPGTGQPIQFRDILKTEPVDIVIIPTHWRAKDIAREIQKEAISCDQILIEHQGQLIDFETDAHPYR